MTRTSNEKYTPTESRRLVRGAGRIFHEYISKLRTQNCFKEGKTPFAEQLVGCDGFTRYREQMLMDVWMRPVM